MKPSTTAPRRLRRDAGVTLTELVVALGVSSVVVAAVLTMLSTGAVLFQDAAASADAQSNLRFAADRIQKDLRVAGLDASPNPMTDPEVLGGANASWVGIKRNADGIYSGGSVAAATHGGVNTSFELDSVTVLGNYANAARHFVFSIGTSGDVTLQPDAVNLTAVTFAEMYKVSSPVALRTRDGVFFGVVTGVNFSGGNGPVVTMSPAPSGTATPTGYSANESMLSPLRFIRYAIEQDPVDATKTDLVRTEVNADNSVASYANRLVLAEYAVGVRFVFCKDTSFTFGSVAATTTFTCATGAVEPISTNPEQLRGVQMSVWVRTPTEMNFAMPSWASNSDLPDIGFNLTSTTTRLARVRKFDVAVELPNYGVK